MKRSILIAVLVLFSAFGLSAQTPDRSKVVTQLRNLIKEQRQEIDRLAENEKKKDQYAKELYTENEKAQTQINTVGTERDGWRDYGNDQHEKLMNAEVRVAKKDATILKLSGTIAALLLAIGVYLFLKFYMRLPI